MTDSMIERVVFAVRKCRFEREGLRFSREHALPPTEAELEDCYDAIEAMRNPTHAMIMAAKDVIDKETLALAQISLTPELMRAAIVAFVHAALSETTT